MKTEENCLFCGIVSGSVPSHKVWENDAYLAFLTIFPNTEGVTVVIPKEHYGSYVFELPDDVAKGLFNASKQVAKAIDAAFPDVGRTGLIFEGFGVNHMHAKLFPMHGTKEGEWREHRSSIDTYSEFYQGYLSSHDAKREVDEKLSATAEKIRKAI